MASSAFASASAPLPPPTPSSSTLPDLSITDAALDPPAHPAPPPPVPMTKKIADLLLWQDPLSSSLALSSGALLTFLIQVSGYSLLTLLSYLGLLQLLICATFINGTKLFLSLRHQTMDSSSSSSTFSSTASSSAPSPSSSSSPSTATPSLAPFVSSLDPPSADYSFVSQDLVLEYSGAIADSLNSLLHSLTLILRCHSHWLTLQAAVVLLVISVIGRLMDAVTLIGLAWVGLFTLPKLYVQHKDEVDQRVARVRALIDGVREQVRKYLPEEDRKRKTD